MKRTSKRGIWGVITGQPEYKIGIAKDVTARNRVINRAIPGTIVVMSSRRISNAYKVEQKMHKLFSGSRFKMKGKKGKTGGGLTEWFYLNWAEYMTLELWLTYYYWRPVLRLIFIIILLALITWAQKNHYL